MTDILDLPGWNPAARRADGDEGKTPLEGCNSRRTGDTRPRGIPVTYAAQHGWTEDGRRIMRPHTYTPVAIACGHLGRATAPGCAGCANQHRA